MRMALRSPEQVSDVSAVNCSRFYFVHSRMSSGGVCTICVMSYDWFRCSIRIRIVLGLSRGEKDHLILAKLSQW